MQSDDALELRGRVVPPAFPLRLDADRESLVNLARLRQRAQLPYVGSSRRRRSASVGLRPRKTARAGKEHERRSGRPAVHAYGAAGGSSASCQWRAEAACSGLQAQPLRPASVIGPKSAGAAEGWSASCSADSIDAALPTPTAAPPAATANSVSASMTRNPNLDITLSIAESLKNR